MKVLSSNSPRCGKGWKTLYLLPLALLTVLSTTAQSASKNVPGITVPGDVQVTFTEFDAPTPNSTPQDAFFRSRDGYAWYSGQSANVLGRIDFKTGKSDEYRLRPGSDPYSLVEHFGSGVQSTMYFTSRTGGFIGEFDPSKHEVREFRILGGKRLLQDIIFDRNGVIWFTALKPKLPLYTQGSQIGSLNLFSSEIKLADTPTKNASPYGLAIDSIGIPFFTELDSPRLGSINPDTMKVTEYLLPNPKIGARGLAITPDDAVWYTDYARGYLGRFEPKTGKFAEWPSPSGARSRPDGIVSVGKVIWYAESGSKPNMLVRFDTETQKFQSWPVKAGEGIRHIHAQADGSLWFTHPLANSVVHVVATGKEE